MTEVSERVSILIREEIELVKAEVTTKVSRLSKGVVFGAIGAVLALLFVPFLLLTIAWGLNSLISSIWLGFLIVTVVLVISMAACFFVAWRKFKAAGTPAPTMAIDEAKKIRETVSAAAESPSSDAGPSASAKTPTPVAVTPTPVAVTPTPVAVTPPPVAVTPAPEEATPAPEAEGPSPVAETPAPESGATPAAETPSEEDGAS